MGIFNSTFRQHIIDELNSRKSHEGRQQAYHPTARVTALVRGKFSDPRLSRLVNNQQFTGFSLGPIDINKSNSLDKLTNISGKGSVIGITYTDGKAQEVTIRSKKNLPSPGVTNITISTQSKGGLVFKATVNFKFYGKEQYDIIYQLFMRPGNPVLIEFGHTKTEESVKQFNNLSFFKDLNDTTPFENDIKQVSKLPAGRNDGRVAGLVSNFKIKLNENNEYEASIDIINALEFLYTLPPEDTFMSYDDNNLSNSIKNNFGYQADDEYDPSYDRIYQLILEDKDRPIGGAADVNTSRSESNPIQFGLSGTYSDHIIEPNLTNEKLVTVPVSGNALVTTTETIQVPIIQNPMLKADYTWVSLNYVLLRLLPVILKESIVCKDGSYQTLVGTAAQIKDYSEGGDFVANIIARRATRERLRTTSQEKFDELSTNNRVSFIFEPIGNYKLLRSSDIKQLIINNFELYKPPRSVDTRSSSEINQIIDRRVLDYMKQFDIDRPSNNEVPKEIEDLFGVINAWITKERYVVNDDSNTTANRGLFLNYQMVRNAFINSSSVSDAIIRLLNLINNNTNGILNLKMRNISVDYRNSSDALRFSEIFKLVIYDENTIPAKEDDIPEIYKFFQNDESEAISYDFDFSLPSSVASTILANKFNRAENNVVGQAQAYQLIYNGYDEDITSMINNESSQNTSDCGGDLKKINTNDLWIRDKNRRSYEIREQAQRAGVEEDKLKEFEDTLNEFYTKIIGYQELFPPQMKSQIIRDGLFNTLPTSARVSIKLVGVDGFRFGDMFGVRNVLPYPYDENNIFMLTGYKHDINSDGWYTTIDGIMIASTPPEKRAVEVIIGPAQAVQS